MNVNYIIQHKEANSKLLEIKGFHSGHISTYNALFLLWNQSGFAKEFQIIRSEVMQLSKVGSANTYTKILKDLQKEGLIQYKPSMNPLLPSMVSLYNFDKGTDKGSNKGGSKGIDKGTDNGDDTYNTINIETIKLINKETIMGLMSVEENVPVLRKLHKLIEEGLPIDKVGVAEVVSYLNQKLNSRFDPKTSVTEKLIGARLKDFSVEGCKKVIDNRVAKWKNDEKMKSYLTPSTLFAESNFEKYLNEATSVLTYTPQHPSPDPRYPTNEELLRLAHEKAAANRTHLNQ